MCQSITGNSKYSEKPGKISQIAFIFSSSIGKNTQKITIHYVTLYMYSRSYIHNNTSRYHLHVTAVKMLVLFSDQKESYVREWEKNYLHISILCNFLQVILGARRDTTKEYLF